MLNQVREWFKWKFKSQKEEILYLLQNNKSVSSCIFAMEYGILRFWACIFNLRKDWYNIKTESKWVKLKNWRTQRQVNYTLLNK